jgi:carboxylesterase
MTTPQDMNRCRWQDWAAALEETYQHLASHCEQIFIGGESMGALLALQLASGHPEAVGLLIYAPALRIAPVKAVLARVLWPFVPYANKKHIEPVDKWQGYRVNPVPALVQMLNLQREVKRHLPDICQPLLLIQGRLDTDIDLRGVETLYREIGSDQKELHWMENSRHVVILDDEFDRVAALTLKFIEKNLE